MVCVSPWYCALAYAWICASVGVAIPNAAAAAALKKATPAGVRVSTPFVTDPLAPEVRFWNVVACCVLSAAEA